MNHSRASIFRATVAVTAVYGYFLIFAQFSFVELLRANGINAATEKFLLGSMAIAGMGGGFFAAWRGVTPTLVRMALVIAGLAACAATWHHGIVSTTCIALATGAALGVATTSLAALLPSWCGPGWIGLGTGLAYALCNVPAIFLQSPTGQAWTGVVFAFTGALAISNKTESTPTTTTAAPAMAFLAAIGVFTSLVWMDSAAFFIIQHADALKSATWGPSQLWRNAGVHLAFACLAGVWLAGGHPKRLPTCAWIILAAAAIMVNHADSRHLAGWIYPAGVSLYSAALVAWPAWFSGVSTTRAAAWRAAWLFAIAGWFGSANGIGMAQALAYVPLALVITAGAILAIALFLTNLHHWRLPLAVTAVALAAWTFSPPNHPMLGMTAAERGHQVYLAEGCLHCHSQYVRPASRDETIWGPTRALDQTLHGKPVIIGNRRQGPDLTNVGARRSATWLKIHFIEPSTLTPKTSMPSYTHLFADGRGDDLIAYLRESASGQTEAIRALAARWQPTVTSLPVKGRPLFSAHCAACHGDLGHGDGKLASKFSKPPANLTKGPFLWTPSGPDLDVRIARVIKFGVPGTDMPGHETMTDAQINALVEEVKNQRSPK